ncbi:MAG: glycine cleavage system aminomethyltransferase GcvT [Candidatus Latescibacteria bacterium]|nr:glycine cleavage system aminomethyltransferase GcvT [Candidatus Latescibacterota bacterium]
MKQTPLYSRHVALGAKMTEFGGWVMPVQYAGITVEHTAVRERAGVFDISHMGEIEVKGPGAEGFLDWLLPGLITGLLPGRIIYSLLCNEQGGAIDDILVYRRGETHFLLVVNAARTSVDVRWVTQHADHVGGVTVEDTSDAYGMIALQGSGAEGIAQRYAEVNLQEVGYYRFTEGRVCGIEALISRTGYTGEDGFEVLCRTADVGHLWDVLIEEACVTPCGLGARDTLRLEMGYALYGHELTEETTPLEAGLGWTVHIEKERFIGKDALVAQKRQGVQRRFVGLMVEERAIPRSDQRVISEAGEKIGYVTSGTFSPSLKRGIALSYVQKGYERPGTKVGVEIRERVVTAQVVKPPFVTSHGNVTTSS